MIECSSGERVQFQTNSNTPSGAERPGADLNCLRQYFRPGPRRLREPSEKFLRRKCFSVFRCGRFARSGAEEKNKTFKSYFLPGNGWTRRGRTGRERTGCGRTGRGRTGSGWTGRGRTGRERTERGRRDVDARREMKGEKGTERKAKEREGKERKGNGEKQRKGKKRKGTERK